jgi:hypothetical protein
MVRNAWGRITRRSCWVKDIPSARDASDWPIAMVLMPERTVSQTNAEPDRISDTAPHQNSGNKTPMSGSPNVTSTSRLSRGMLRKNST